MVSKFSGGPALHCLNLKSAGGTTDPARSPHPTSAPSPQPGTLWPHGLLTVLRRFLLDFHLRFSPGRGFSVPLNPSETQPGHWPPTSCLEMQGAI